ncbi:MAG: hypothetical protein J5892_02690 [Bacilli bacterium]|nr:hypothetical protein [Bacilli bacterium]
MKIIVNKQNYEADLMFTINTATGTKNVIMYTDDKVLDGGFYAFFIGELIGNQISSISGEYWQLVTNTIINMIKTNQPPVFNLPTGELEAVNNIGGIRVPIDTIIIYRNSIKDRVFQVEPQPMPPVYQSVVTPIPVVNTINNPTPMVSNPNEYMYSQPAPAPAPVVSQPSNEPIATPDSFKDTFAKEVDNILTNQEAVAENLIEASSDIKKLEEKVSAMEQRINALETALKQSYQTYNNQQPVEEQSVDVFGKLAA